MTDEQQAAARMKAREYAKRRRDALAELIRSANELCELQEQELMRMGFDPSASSGQVDGE
jgi:hypothetical protein